MPFVTEYTPTEALFALAQKAGNAQGIQTGAALALQYKQIAMQERRDLTNAYLQKLSMDNQAQRDANQIQMQQQNYGLAQDAQAFDRQKFNKTFDLQTAIEERKQQTTMTPTQQFQQKLALEAAKAGFKTQAEARAAEEFKVQEDYKQKNKIQFETLKGNIGGAGTGVDLKALKPELSNAYADYQRLAARRNALGDKLKYGYNGVPLGAVERTAAEQEYTVLDKSYKKAQARYEAASSAMEKLALPKDGGLGLDSPNAFPQQAPQESPIGQYKGEPIYQDPGEGNRISGRIYKLGTNQYKREP
jgi:hypothetical protein